MNWRVAFPGDYLAADDLPHDRVFTWHISAVAMDHVQQINDSSTKKRDESKMVIAFAELDAKAKRERNTARRWIPCKTSAKVLREQYGKETDEWIGKPASLIQTVCNSFGEPNTPCIRVVHAFHGSKSCRFCFRGDQGFRDRHALVHQVNRAKSSPPESETPPSTGLDTRPDSAGKPLDSLPAPVSEHPGAGAPVAIPDAASVGELSDSDLARYAEIEQAIAESTDQVSIDDALSRAANLPEPERLALLSLADKRQL